MDRNHLHQSADVLHFGETGKTLLSYHQEEHGVRDKPHHQGHGFRHRLCGVRSGKDHNKFEEMHLTPGKASVVNAPIIEESPLNIECRVKEIVSLGSHDVFIADVVNVKADEKFIDSETGKFELAKTNLLVYIHGGYYETGAKVGKFGWSVEKKK